MPECAKPGSPLPDPPDPPDPRVALHPLRGLRSTRGYHPPPASRAETTRIDPSTLSDFLAHFPNNRSARVATSVVPPALESGWSGLPFRCAAAWLHAHYLAKPPVGGRRGAISISMGVASADGLAR